MIRPLRGSSALQVSLAYLVITLVMTWPLAAGIARDVPGDLGDSLLNMWILGWGAEHVPAFLTGQTSLAEYWNANIFHPEPLALGFSEHLFGEVLQILPVYWLTGNLILCYNLLFISSFVLSGLGMFLLVRDLLAAQSRAEMLFPPRHVALAAFIAGLIFAFIPFRIAQVAHIQSLQAAWMPFALYGFRRFIVSGRTTALVGGTAALLMQNWTNGYYLIYFAPFVPVFVAHQMWTTSHARDLRRWLAFAAAAAVVAAGTWPFLSLYLETQRVHGFERPIGEVIKFSADVYSYFTAPDALRVWGGVMQMYPKPEGELFFGFVPWMLFVVGVVLAGRSVNAARSRADMPPFAWILIAFIAVQVMGLILIFFSGGFITSVAGIPVRATNPARIVNGLCVCLGVLLAAAPRARVHAVAALRTPWILCAGFALLAIVLSLGPMPQSFGRPLTGFDLYRTLYEQVPGFAGLRVPARYAMIAAVFCSVVAGFGALWVMHRAKAKAVAVAFALAAAFLVEAWFAPMPVNVSWSEAPGGLPPRVFPSADAPAVYHTIATLPDDAVVAEFPFGDAAWELRYVYYSTVHWKRLINGYSGGFPQGYKARVAVLQRVRENPDLAWRALRDAGATHVIVHEGAMPADEAAMIVKWLNDHFAVEIARFEGDLLFDVTGVWPPK